MLQELSYEIMVFNFQCYKGSSVKQIILDANF
jgi:hypothetical protein